MEKKTDNSSLYGSPEGYAKVIANYDRTMQKMGMAYQSRYVETRFGLTHIIACGNENGKPVVLWHGQNANATTWVRWMPALAADYCVYAIDTIGAMGKSAATRPSRKGSAYGEWAREVLQALDLPPANMIGASNGGWLILKLSSVAPEMIGNAILLSSAGLMSVSMKLVFQIVTRSLNKDPKVVAERLVEVLSPPDLSADPFYLEFFELILTSKFKGEPMAPRLKDEEICKLRAPTYILMGQYERSFNPYKAIERALKLLPSVVKTEIVPGVGHSMEHRQPDWVLSRIVDYLAKYAV